MSTKKITFFKVFLQGVEVLTAKAVLMNFELVLRRLKGVWIGGCWFWVGVRKGEWFFKVDSGKIKGIKNINTPQIK